MSRIDDMFKTVTAVKSFLAQGFKATRALEAGLAISIKALELDFGIAGMVALQ